MSTPRRIRFSHTRIGKLEIYNLEDADFLDCEITEVKIGETQSSTQKVSE